MTADDVWVIFFDAKKTEGMVSMSTMQRWNAQPHEMFVTGKFSYKIPSEELMQLWTARRSLCNEGMLVSQ